MWIHITLPGDLSLGHLTRDDEHNLARRIGDEAEIENVDEIKIGCKDGVLHLARLRPSAPGAEEEAVADGNVDTVLSSSQILRGRLRRGLTSPVRDVFDVVCAARADARALATAESMLEEPAAERIATRWRLQDKDFEKAAQKELQGVPPRFETDLSLLSTEAAEALETHRSAHPADRTGRFGAPAMPTLLRYRGPPLRNRGVGRHRVRASTTSLSGLAMRALTTCRAGISTVAAVAGLRPVRRSRFCTTSFAMPGSTNSPHHNLPSAGWLEPGLQLVPRDLPTVDQFGEAVVVPACWR